MDLTERRCNRSWNALDASSSHPLSNEAQDLTGTIETIQQSFEQIIVIDSADVEIVTTDTQAALSVQVALQAAIALVISISIADSDRAERITQDLLGRLRSSQVNRQQTYVENSRGVRITTTDTDLVVNIQLLLQVLVALLVRIGIL
ncbi:spore coat protein [Pseudobacillus wudalianchiensis]|uniref:Spore coat protein n=1 Tax=Pseudobacillus wudalianchiensis TaxID=1743143 RepID=A0A1B9B766_9BACI|nr:spore coat protein [Bacillus wudalianchiensis]OCA91937.1 spore coat protein [Bacillus wudalianchiensis]